jgi:cyclase
VTGRGRALLAASVLVAGPAARAQDFDAARIVTEPLGNGLYVILTEGEGIVAGNVLVSVGADGTLLVDDQVPGTAPKLEAAIAALGGGDVKFVINTDWHVESAGSNALLAGKGAWIIAQENSRQMMLHEHSVNLVTKSFDQPAFAEQALPVISYDTTMRMHFNGDRIDLMHFGPAHTSGDTAVILHARNLAHLGDVFNTSAYPFIDADNGGSLEGLIDFSESALGELEPGAVVIPGHGPVSNYDGLAGYISMLKTIRDRMSALVGSGATLEQVVAARPTSDWDASMGDPAVLIDRAYASMTR